MIRDTTISRITATEVIVPAKPGTLNSGSVLDTDTVFAKKLLTGNSWVDFANQPKWIIQIWLANGLVGIGETYRNAKELPLKAGLNQLAGKDVMNLNWRKLPIENLRIYEAFETAILDVAGKYLGVPICQLLGGANRDRIECMGWTGRRTPKDAASKAFEAMKKGHKVFKFKCSNDDPVRMWLEKIKQKCGTGIKIVLDPNQRWKDISTTLKMMEGVDTQQIFCLEDPILHEDFEGYKVLRKSLGVPIFRHISLPYDQDIRDIFSLIKLDAVDGYNFNGPAFNSILLAEIANLQGKGCWRGSEVDLGISETMAMHIARASPGCSLPSDIFGELVRVDDLIETPISFENGFAIPPQGDGLGTNLDLVALERYGTGKIINTN
ncbi:MAG: mandelate racemase [Cyclobacteriaceae bacterium]|nr:MAG: mandelate racemase [Cyclobacteriaceae bacterium]